jgi:hypothetical protein
MYFTGVCTMRNPTEPTLDSPVGVLTGPDMNLLGPGGPQIHVGDALPLARPPQLIGDEK